MKKRVVVTGLGAVTPLGNNVNDFYDGIKEGKCGISPITLFDTEKFKVKIAGEVKDFNPESVIGRKSTRRMDRFCQFAMVAAHEAVEDSKIDLDKIDKNRFGVVVGSGIGGLRTIEDQHTKLMEKGPSRISPFLIPMIIGNMAAGNIAIEFGAKGVCTNIVTACASSTQCIGEAFKMIQDGRADVIIAGGTEAAITPLSIAGFTSMTALSNSNDPSRASIPFDKERSGFVMGEGAGIIILESLEHASKRGARIYSEMAGYGTSCDAYHMTAPSPDGEGPARAMTEAIKDAGIEPSEVSYINAHGTGTPYNDRCETLAVKKAFGDAAYKIPMSSTKSMTGHLLGAAGGIEAVACIKSMEDNFVPATIGYKEPDPECDLDCVPNKGREQELNYVMSNSLGFGGHNASIIFRSWRDR